MDPIVIWHDLQEKHSKQQIRGCGDGETIIGSSLEFTLFLSLESMCWKLCLMGNWRGGS